MRKRAGGWELLPHPPLMRMIVGAAARKATKMCTSGGAAICKGEEDGESRVLGGDINGRRTATTTASFSRQTAPLGARLASWVLSF